ncbi:MAG: hypothetical protein D6741_16785, partial [Planctomycetota bacterium]
TVRTRLSYDLYEADCIIWAPDAFSPPSEETRKFLDDWLDISGYHLIFIGREYSAFPYYYESVATVVDDSRQQAVYQAEAETQAAIFGTVVESLPQKEECPWYSVHRTGRRRVLRRVDGSPQLLRGVDRNNVHLELYAQWKPPEDAEILLTAGPDNAPFVFRTPIESDPASLWGPLEADEGGTSDSPLLEEAPPTYRWVIANGSFLFNVPLVDHENRRLAANLIDALGDEPLNIVILETKTTDVPIGDETTQSESPGIFRAYPLNWILIHWTAVAVLVLFMRYPLFGKPQDLTTKASTDFGQHVVALADLLRRTRDAAFAQECVDLWLSRRKRQKIAEGSPPD